MAPRLFFDALPGVTGRLSPECCNVTIPLQLKHPYCTFEISLVRCDCGIQPFNG